MDNRIIGARIVQIIKVMLDEILLELYLNIKKDKNLYYLKFSICNDGEKISFNLHDGWYKSELYGEKSFSAIVISNEKLSVLLENEILDVKYGIGEELFNKKKALYYVKVKTDKNEFLLFNNGDQGWCSLNCSDEILANDIYDFQWFDTAPAGNRYGGG